MPVGAPCPNFPNCDCEDCSFPCKICGERVGAYRLREHEQSHEEPDEPAVSTTPETPAAGSRRRCPKHGYGPCKCGIYAAIWKLVKLGIKD